MTRTAILAFAFLLTAPSIIGQFDGPRGCGMDSVHTYLMGLPGYEDGFRHRLEMVSEHIAVNDISDRSECDDPLIIPVAVHFQNAGIDLACATDMALDQIEILNNDFAGTNGDLNVFTDLQGAMWQGINNGESCICFCLATLNHPAGFGLEDGDFAITIDQTAGDNDPAWSGYLNFFVRPIGGGVLGYSPLGGLGNGDGVTCDPAYFSSISCGGNVVSPPYHLGRTMSHEVGHYLLLEHPWAAGGCASDDLVADTPVTDQPTFGCPGGELINCVDPVLWPSYMDYCDDPCLVMFSQGQVQRMESYAETSLVDVLDNSVTVCQETVCLDFEVEVAFDDESCAGDDGFILLDASGGEEPYTYSVNGGLTFTGADLFDNLSEDIYDIVVIDENDCEFTETVELVQEDADIELLSSENEYCSDAQGMIEVVVNELSDFQYSLNGSDWQDEPMFDHLSAGVYNVSVKNNAGCSGELEIILENDSDLEVDLDITAVNCDWFDNGSLILGVSGATNPVQYVLDGFNESDDGTFEQLSQGQHHILVTDAEGCVLQQFFEIPRSYETIAEDCPCQVFIPNAITVDGDGNNEILGIVPSCPITNFNISIYNRWGNVVFESSEPNFVWNGGIDEYYVEDEIYVYRMTYQWGEVDNSNIEVQETVGHVVVIR